MIDNTLVHADVKVGGKMFLLIDLGESSSALTI